MERKSKNLMNDGVKKQLVQDVDEHDAPQHSTPATMSGVRRSIRDIPIPQNGGVEKGSLKHEGTPLDHGGGNGGDNDHVDAGSHSPKDRSKYVLWGIVLVSVIALVFAISSLFTGATVTITPKSQQVTLNDTLTASKNGEAEVPFQVVQISDTASQTVSSDSEEYSESRASGQITIFNTHSSSEQILIDQTRFETPDGKIYRIQEEVRVPGQREVDGELVPGQLEVTVYADEAGSDYNIDLTDFTIPGFEGDPRFETFYAQSKTPMTGGFAGTKPVVNEETQDQAEAELEESLRNTLATDLTSRVSDNLIIPENGSFYTFETLPATMQEDGSVELVVKGTVKAVALPSTDFAKAILRKAGGSSNSPVEIQDLTSVQTTLRASEEFDVANSSEASISVTGEALLVWSFDENRVKNDLTGKQKKNISSVLSSYESIESATAVIRPFWKRSFPNSSEKINIRVTLEE